MEGGMWRLGGHFMRTMDYVLLQIVHVVLILFYYFIG